jgi:hypothetical protein
MGADAVKIYCPKCHQVYHPPPVRSRASNGTGVDGAAFGTTFPHLFLMTFSNLVPDPLPVEATYVPRVFGFRVHKSARQRTSSATANAAANANANAANDVANDAANDAAVNANAGQNVTGSSNSVNNLNGSMNGFAKKEEDEELQTNSALAAGVEEPELGEDDEDKKLKSKGKRGRKETDPKKPEVANGGTTGTAGPTFLMENPVKRRRRNNGST